MGLQRCLPMWRCHSCCTPVQPPKPPPCACVPVPAQVVAPELPADFMDLDEPVHEEDAADVKARKLKQQEERRLAEERKKSKVGGGAGVLSRETC